MMTWPTISDSRLENYDRLKLPGQQLSASQASTPLDYQLNLNPNSIPGCQRLTGILACIGRCNYDVETYEKMIEAGMNIASLNMSYGSRKEHTETINKLRIAAKNYSNTMGSHYPLGIAIRLSGRKIKTGGIAENQGKYIEIKTDEVIRLTTDETYRNICSKTAIFVDFDDFAEQLKPGDVILLDGARIVLKVEIISSTTLTCRVQVGGLLGSHQDVFTPKVAMKMPTCSEKDKLDIKMAIKAGIDIIVVSSVNSADTIHELRSELGEKGKYMAIIANIQKEEGIKNFEEIVKVANGIMISRRELGLDIKPDKLVIAQKNLIARANRANVPVLLAVNFQSDEQLKTGTQRSVLLDLSNCVLDGVDCIRLCPGTVVGIDPIETLTILTSTCKEAELCVWSQQTLLDHIDKTPRPSNQAVPVAIAAVFAAHKCLATAIVVVTNSGRSAKTVSKYQPRCPILTVTRYASVARQLQMFKGIIPLCYEAPPVDWTTDLENRYNFAVKWAMDRGFVKSYDPIVIIHGRKRGPGYTNTMKITYAYKS